jgi:hypothetical protein
LGVDGELYYLLELRIIGDIEGRAEKLAREELPVV